MRIAHTVDRSRIGDAFGHGPDAREVSAGQLDRREEAAVFGERSDGGAQKVRASVRAALVDGAASTSEVLESLRGVFGSHHDSAAVAACLAPRRRVGRYGD